jgi:hypothetical protein
MDLSFGAKGNLWAVDSKTVIDLDKVITIIDRDKEGDGVMVIFTNGEMMAIPGASGEALWARTVSLCLNQSQFSKKVDNA